MKRLAFLLIVVSLLALSVSKASATLKFEVHMGTADMVMSTADMAMGAGDCENCQTGNMNDCLSTLFGSSSSASHSHCISGFAGAMYLSSSYSLTPIPPILINDTQYLFSSQVYFSAPHLRPPIYT